MMTVCDGIVLEYRRNFSSGTGSGAQRSALASPLPEAYARGQFAHDSPSAAVPSRGIETMIEVMRM
jgi:hypothetical protein